jgi:hypothetical protein
MDIERAKQPRLSVLEPWWRAWLWAFLLWFFPILGFVLGALAGYLCVMYRISQGFASQNESGYFYFFYVILPGLLGAKYGGKGGARLVRALRGRSGQEPAAIPSQTTENEQSRRLVSSTDCDSIQADNSQLS